MSKTIHIEIEFDGDVPDTESVAYTFAEQLEPVLQGKTVSDTVWGWGRHRVTTVRPVIDGTARVTVREQQKRAAS